MAGNFFGKVGADMLGISDIGRIIEPKDYDKVDADDYIMQEDGEEIKFLIKSKSDEYCFTNYALIHVDGESAMSKKRTVKRYEYYYKQVSDVLIETAGTIDADVEVKFKIGSDSFSIDVDKRQIEELKDLYKALIEINKVQGKNNKSQLDSREALKVATDVMSNCRIDGMSTSVADHMKSITNFSLSWLEATRDKYNNKDLGYVFDKYINN